MKWQTSIVASIVAFGAVTWTAALSGAEDADSSTPERNAAQVEGIVAKAKPETSDAKQPSRLKVTALRGTLESFWGTVAKLRHDLWLVETRSGTSVVVASEGDLIAYHPDGREPTMAIVEQGSPADFMTLSSRLQPGGQAGGDRDPGTPCGECADQTCCNANCEPPSAPWCVCSATVACAGTGGICGMEIGVNGECAWECCGPGSGSGG